MLKLTKQASEAMVTDVSAAAANNVDGILSDVWFGLFSNWDGYDPNMTLANLDESNVDGYVRKAVTWSPAYIGSDGRGSMISDLANWVPTGNNVDQLILGAFIASAETTGDLIGVDLFDTPVRLASATDRLNYALEFGIDPASDFGQSTVIS